MRLIDADELLKGHQDHELISTHLIWNAPTIDAVEVVRCRECKWCSGKYFDGSQRKNLLCRVFNRYVEADDYCSHGVRKEPDDVPLP